MQRIVREQARKYAFDWRDEPLLRVRPGETFEIETYDASTGFFKTPQDLAIPGKRPGFHHVPPLANPIGGPVFVHGAEPGDVLAVDIETITVEDSALEMIVTQGYSLAYGARFLKRFIDERIKLPISSTWKDNAHFQVVAKDGQIAVEPQIMSATEAIEYGDVA